MAINQLSATNYGVAGLNTPIQSQKDAPIQAGKEVSKTAPTAPDQTASISQEQVKKSLDAINKFISNAGDIQFSQDAETGKTMVKIVDTKTDTVLRQIPSKVAIAISQGLDRFQGLLLRDKV